MSKISVTTIAGLTSGGDANKVKIESGDDLEVVSGETTLGGGAKVNTIKHTSGTTALTIDTSGNVIESNYVLDQWRLNTNFTSHATTINTGWERPDDATYGRIGTGMTESSGIFTFPSTGLWMVTVCARMYVSGADGTVGVALKVSSNSGGSTDTVGSAYEGDTSSNDSNAQATSVALINVTNASTFQFSLLTISVASGSAIVGSTDENATHITFERKGPSQ